MIAGAGRSCAPRPALLATTRKRTSTGIDERSMVGWCMLHGQVRLALDVAEDPMHFNNPLLPATRSEMALPLINWGRVIGAITLQSDRPRDFTKDDAAVLQTMADQVAIAINNAQLYAAEQRHAALMTALHDIGLDLSAQLDLATLLQTIVRRAAQLLGAPVGELLLMQPDGESLREAARFAVTSHSSDIRLGEGISSRVAQTGEPLIIEDYGQWPGRIEALGPVNFRSVLGVPVQWRSRVLGILNVLDDRPAQFDQADATVLQLFAVQAAVALENARLFEAAWRQVNELNILHEVASAASTAVEEKELIAHTMEVLSGTLNVDYLDILLKDETLQGLPIDVYSHGVHLSLPTEIIPLGRGITGAVALTGQARRIDDVRRAPDYYQYNLDVLSELCVPLKVSDRILGVINGESRQLAAFSEADEQLLSTVAGQLGTAIDRLRTEAARRQNEEELAQERNLLRTLIDNLSDTHIFVKDMHSRFITTNAEHLRTMGLTGLEQVMGKTDFDFFDQADAEQYFADDQAALNTGEPVLGRVEKIRDSSGKTRWYLTNKIPLRDKEGKISGLVGASVNITERQRAAEREQAIARGLQAVVEAADEILQIDDLDLFYRRAVELAREKMNVERCGIFLLDAERQLLLGTYGTDLQRCTTDERGVKTSIVDRPEFFALGARRLVVPALEQGYWNHGIFQPVGTGWVALTLIGSGPDPIGVFFNDTPISRSPVDEMQQEHAGSIARCWAISSSANAPRRNVRR
jgi:PAS domain S-box-containing protein